MSEKEKDTLHGLACPQCGGMVPIPEGEVIVKCPYCDLRSMVRGERGLHRYQVPKSIDRDQALVSLRGFLTRSRAIAMNAAKDSRLSEAFIAYLPFWTSWARLLGWVFGQKRVSSGKSTTYRPKEVKIAQDMVWNGAACDVGEFGVNAVPLTTQPLEPFNPVTLHETGLVFEPVGSISDARTAAANDFNNRLREGAKLDRIGQIFSRSVRQRMGLVYYPLWVMRYLYRGRSFQVVVDGYSGQVLYGKAPGNTLYRAAVLVGGMAVGALLAVDFSSLAWYFGFSNDVKGDSAGMVIAFGFAMVVAGLALMLKAYSAFRYGEQYEYRLGKKKAGQSLIDVGNLMSQVKELTSWTDQ
jgi:hypothetical protein